MTEENASARLIVAVDLGDQVNPDKLDLQTRQLRKELLELPFDSVDFVRNADLPEGTKSMEAITLGTLGLAVLPELIPKLVEYLHSWTMRAENRKVNVKTQVGDRSIELEYSPAALSPEELKNLVETLTGALAGG